MSDSHSSRQRTFARLQRDWAPTEQGKHPCQCGCGQQIRVKPRHYYTGVPKFIGGHNQNRFDAAGKEAICRDYLAGLSLSQVAAKHGVGGSPGVWRILRDAGIQARTNRKTSEAQKQEMCRRYVAGESAEQLGTTFGLDASTVLDMLERRGIARRRCGTRRRYKVDEAAFDNPTAEGAYWIGFLMADGGIPGGKYVQLALSVCDAGHVESALRRKPVTLLKAARCYETTEPPHKAEPREPGGAISCQVLSYT